MSLDSLFQPIPINGLTLQNRMVMLAMGTLFANENGAVTRQLIDYHVQRAKGGGGLQIVEQSIINRERPSCMLSVASDHMLPGLKDVAFLEDIGQRSNPGGKFMVHHFLRLCLLKLDSFIRGYFRVSSMAFLHFYC